MRSSIQDNPRDPAEVNVEGRLAICRVKDPDHAEEAYGKGALPQ